MQLWTRWPDMLRPLQVVGDVHTQQLERRDAFHRRAAQGDGQWRVPAEN